jgi:hypothetical protein
MVSRKRTRHWPPRGAGASTRWPQLSQRRSRRRRARRVRRRSGSMDPRSLLGPSRREPVLTRSSSPGAAPRYGPHGSRRRRAHRPWRSCSPMPPRARPRTSQKRTWPEGRVSAELARCARWGGCRTGGSRSARYASPPARRINAAHGVDWRPSPVWSHPPPHERERRSGWPSWATWGLVGTGVAVAAGVVVAAVAASSSRSPSEVEYVQGPLIQGPPK